MSNKTEAPCAFCGTTFVVTRMGRMYCSQKCANKSYQLKHYVPKPKLAKKELILRGDDYNWGAEVDPWYNGSMNDGMNQMWG